MEIALTVIILLLVAVIGWVLAHNSQCSSFHERMASLEAASLLSFWSTKEGRTGGERDA